MIRWCLCICVRAAIFILSVWAVPLSSAAKDVAEIRHRDFSAMVNLYGVELQMIVGSKRPDDSCRLRLHADYIDNQSPDLQRIYQEIQRSQVPLEIRRFNQPRTQLDQSTFELNDETCEVRRYIGAAKGFRPPSNKAGKVFSFTYSPKVSAARPQLEVQLENGVPRLVIDSDENKTQIDISQVGKTACCAGKNTVVLSYNGVELADWDRRDWSVLKNARKGRYLLRVRSAEGLTTLNPGDVLKFTVGTILSIHEPTVRSGVKQVATIQVRQPQDVPFFIQARNGRTFWAAPPNVFEIQLANALRSTGRQTKDAIQLTFDRQTMAQVRELLDNAGSQLTAHIELSKRARRPVYGSLTIMDGHTGAVYASAGFPVTQTPTPYSNGEYDQFNELDESFKRRVIGSVAKAPLGLAVILAHPALSELRINSFGESEFETILGMEINPSLSDHGTSSCGSQIDFSCFVAKSSNRYAATLLALGAVPISDSVDAFTSGTFALGADSFWLGDPKLTPKINKQPSTFLYRNKPSGDSIDALPWAREVRRLFDIRTRVDPGVLLAPQIHDYVWRHAFKDALLPARMDAFVSISPEMENLQLNLASDFRNQYLNLIIGGSESRWSSVKVAETFARIVSLRRVQASFVHPGDAQQQTKEPFNTLLDGENPSRREAHGRMLTGLLRVPVGGTAPWLNGAMRSIRENAQMKGLELLVYAKTGTPRVDTFITGARTSVISKLIQKRIVEVKARVDEPGGVDFFYRGRKIDLSDGATNVRNKSNASGAHEQSDFGGGAMRKSILDFFAMLNKETGINQRSYCQFTGAQVTCADPQVLTKSNDDGRNLAIYIETRRGEQHCSAVSVAYSHSITNGGDDAFFQDMVSKSLVFNGPVFRHLKLNTNEVCPG